MGGAKRAASKAVKKVTAKVPAAAPLIKLQGAMTDPLGVVTGQNALQALGVGGQQQAMAMGGAGGVSAMGVAPGFESLRDESGNLRSQYALDPSKSAAFAELQKQAMAKPGESAWAKMQLDRQGIEEQMQKEGAGRSAQTALAQTQGQLMRTGGLSSGARNRLAMQTSRDTARAQQDVARQGMLSRLGIGESDIGRQSQLLAQVGQTELGAQEKNLAQLTGDIQSKRDFDLERYRQQMAAFGADKTANAQIQAANRSSKK